jgi:hypothetical protein
MKIPERVSITYPPHTKGQVIIPVSSEDQVILHLFPNCTCTTVEKSIVIQGDKDISIDLKAFAGGKFTKGIGYEVFSLTNTLLQKGRVDIDITIGA